MNANEPLSMKDQPVTPYILRFYGNPNIDLYFYTKAGAVAVQQQHIRACQRARWRKWIFGPVFPAVELTDDLGQRMALQALQCPVTTIFRTDLLYFHRAMQAEHERMTRECDDKYGGGGPGFKPPSRG